MQSHRRKVAQDSGQLTCYNDDNLLVTMIDGWARNCCVPYCGSALTIFVNATATPFRWWRGRQMTPEIRFLTKNSLSGYLMEFADRIQVMPHLLMHSLRNCSGLQSLLDCALARGLELTGTTMGNLQLMNWHDH